MPWLSRLAIRQKRFKIPADLIQDFFTRGFERLAFAHHLRHVFGIIVRHGARFFIRVFACAKGRVNRLARAPDLIGFTDMIASVSQ